MMIARSEDHRADDDRQRGVLVLLDLLADRERRDLHDDPEGDAEDDETEDRVGEGDQKRVQCRESDSSLPSVKAAVPERSIAAVRRAAQPAGDIFRCADARARIPRQSRNA